MSEIVSNLFNPLELLRLSDGREGLTNIACRYIYDSHILGKVIVDTLPNYYFSAKREVEFPSFPDFVQNAFDVVSERHHIEVKMKQLITKMLMFGRAHGWILTPLHSEVDQLLNPYEMLGRSDWDLNIADPLFATAVVDLKPSSPRYQQVIRLSAGSRNINPTRYFTATNSIMVDLVYQTSSLSYLGTSIYKNVWRDMLLYSDNTVSLGEVIGKTGLYIRKTSKSRGLFNAVSAKTKQVINNSRQVIKNMGAGDVAIMDNDESLDFFQAGSISAAIAGNYPTILKNLSIATQIPYALFEQQGLAGMIAEGTETTRLIEQRLKSFGRESIEPNYEIVDTLCIAEMVSEGFMQTLKSVDSRYKDFSPIMVMAALLKDKKADRGAILPESKAEKIANQSAILANIKMIGETLGDLEFIEKEVNKTGFFSSKISLNKEVAMQTMGVADKSTPAPAPTGEAK